MEPTTPKVGTVAIVLAEASSSPQWIETFSDEREIAALEQAISEGSNDPIKAVYAFRERLEQEDEEFGDYVEELLTQKLVRPEIQDHGVAWLRSKLKIQEYRKQEEDAAEVIATYAMARVRENPKLDDFMLAGQGIKVRVRVFKVKLPCGAQIIAA